jgi:hypothetical protein
MAKEPDASYTQKSHRALLEIRRSILRKLARRIREEKIAES